MCVCVCVCVWHTVTLKSCMSWYMSFSSPNPSAEVDSSRITSEGEASTSLLLHFKSHVACSVITTLYFGERDFAKPQMK